MPGGKASTDFTARVEADLDADTMSITDLALTVLDTSVNGKLDAQRFQTETPAAQGVLTIKGKDLATLLRVAEQDALAKDVAKLKDRSFDIQLNLDADMKPGNVKLSDLSAKLLGATVKGQLDAARVNTDEPAVTGQLDAAGPDLPLLMRLAGQFQEGEEKSLVDMGRKLAGARNKAFVVKTQFDADMDSGKVNLPQLNITTLGLNVRGNLKADNINKSSGGIAGKLAIDGKGIGPLLRGARSGRPV